MNQGGVESHTEIMWDVSCLFSSTVIFSGLTLVSHLLMSETPVLIPHVVWLISLYTCLCNRKMPWGHVSAQHLLQWTSSPPLPPLQPYHTISFLQQLPDFSWPLFPLWCIRQMQPTTACISASQSGSRGYQSQVEMFPVEECPISLIHFTLKSQ